MRGRTQIGSVTLGLGAIRAGACDALQPGSRVSKVRLTLTYSEPHVTCSPRQFYSHSPTASGTMHLSSILGTFVNGQDVHCEETKRFHTFLHLDFDANIDVRMDSGCGRKREDALVCEGIGGRGYCTLARATIAV
jgi:hypothetical protein